MKATQKKFFSEEQRLDDLVNEGDPLMKLNDCINWEVFRPILRNTFKKDPKGPGGRPAFDHVLMFKILVLQRMYNLSDHKTQFQIMDRLSFMRFLGLGLDDKVPDAKTIWHFKEILLQSNKIERLFNRFNKELKEKNLMMNKGSIIDASFVDVPIQRNNKDENDTIKEDKIPEGWSEKKQQHKDTDARWQTKNNEKHFGYKNHVKVDKKSKLIKNYATTSANTHDSQTLESLLKKSEDEHHDLFADSAYTGEKLRELLKKLKIRNRIHEKGYRGRPLNDHQKERNKKLSKVRARVEHVFGFIENSMNGMRIRCLGLKRASGTIGLMNLTYNICRSCQLSSV